jgi:2-iminobutanoate/2-iminopropanoate deaminase
MTDTPPLSTFREAGELIFFSGCLPKDLDTGRPVLGDITVQTIATLNLVARNLEAAGCSLGDVVRVGVFLADIDRDFDAFNEVYRSYFTAPYPARTTTGATLRGALVEVEIVARAPSGARP